MDIHTIARRAATQMHDDQFDLVTRRAAISQTHSNCTSVAVYFIKYMLISVLANLAGFVFYMLAAIVMMAIAQKVWGV